MGRYTNIKMISYTSVTPVESWITSRELLMGFTQRPGWDTLKAVENNRICSIFHGFSFRIYNFAGIQAFAKWFYPDEFKDLEPEENLKEFHERFLPVDYSSVWMISLEE